MARPPAPTDRPEWPIDECETCTTDAANAPVGEVYDHLGTEHEAVQSAAFDVILAERTAGRFISTPDGAPPASDD